MALGQEAGRGSCPFLGPGGVTCPQTSREEISETVGTLLSADFKDCETEAKRGEGTHTMAEPAPEPSLWLLSPVLLLFPAAPID